MYRKMAFLAALAAGAALAAPAEDAAIVSQLDRDYQHAVKTQRCGDHRAHPCR